MKKQKTDEAPASATAAPAPAAGAGGSAVVGSAAGAGQPNVVWAKGTGYGYGANRAAGGQLWDPKAAAAAQEAQDEQLCGLLQGLASALDEELRGPADVATADGLAAAAAAGSSGQQQQSPSAGSVEPMDVGLSPQQQECLAAVQGSVLLPMLAREFGKVWAVGMLRWASAARPVSLVTCCFAWESCHCLLPI